MSAGYGIQLCDREINMILWLYLKGYMYNMYIFIEMHEQVIQFLLHI